MLLIEPTVWSRRSVVVLSIAMLTVAGCLEPQATDEAAGLEFLDEQACSAIPACTVEEGVIVLRGISSDVASGGAALVVRQVRQSVSIEDSSWSGFGHPVKFESVSCPDCSIRLSNVTLLGAPRAAGGTAITINASFFAPQHYAPRFVLDDVAIAGFDEGIHVLDAGAVSMKGVQIACARIGITVSHPAGIPADVDMVNVSVVAGSECDQAGERGLRVAAANATFVQSKIRGYEEGALLVSGGIVEIRRCSVSGNGLGLDLPRGTATVSGCTFVSNEIGLRGGTGLSIRDSSFTGNARYGLEAAGALAVDARCNWWGSELGPTQIIETAGPAERGDAVSGAAQVNPFLTAPPEDAQDTCIAP